MLPNAQIWRNHFEYHALHPRRLPQALSNHLSASERHVIARSIATFQLGEQSGGTHLLGAAYRFAEQHDAAEIARITELLIREEQQHAALLLSFMNEHGIARRPSDWTDRIFRRLRRLAGLELAVSVLVVAELIGIVYYRALEQATGCQKLRRLCRLLVADELAHVGYESDLLQAMRARRGALARASLEAAQRSLFAAASLAVWITHRRVLLRGGLRLGSFLSACQGQYRFHLQPARPEIQAGAG